MQQKTREKLIETAERLFAERGVYAVSLRQINLAAQQRNGSALHYHFGTRENLIRAVFEHRMEGINNHRLAMLKELIERFAPGQPDLRSVVKALVVPAGQHLSKPGVTYYSRFLAHSLADQSLGMAEIAADKFDQGMRDVKRLIYVLLQGFPRNVIAHRIAMAQTCYLFWFAGYEVNKQTQNADAITKYELVIENLTDSIIGMLSAPISVDTQEVL